MQSFTKTSVPFTKTNSFEKIVIDYINDDDFLKKFYDFEDSTDGISERIKNYQNSGLSRENLKEILFSQYRSANIQAHENVLKNIESLSENNAFTITTGHQLNIFGGPLYVIYKLISVIKLSEKLKETFPQYNFIPVYWMATEDHDIEEISSFNLFGKPYKWQSEWKGIAGKMPLTSLDTIINELKTVFGSSSNADSLISLISESYGQSSNLGEAARKFINSLLGKYGLVIIDGNESGFKNKFKEVIKDELFNQSALKIITESTIDFKSKYDLQVNPREINLFYIDENSRERIIRENDKFRILNRDIIFTGEEILRELNAHPERFSPNVLLRPLYQESILPNIAYIGGPAEIAYWLELKAFFKYHKIGFPVLFLRSCAMIVEKNIKQNLDKLSLSLNDVFLHSDELARIYLQSHSEEELSLQKTRELIMEEFVRLGQEIHKIDTTLLPVIEAEKQKIISSIESIEQKVIRSQKKKNETELNKIKKIKEKLFPGGKLQERNETIIPFYLKWGDDFIEALKKNLNPLEKTFVILEEDSD